MLTKTVTETAFDRNGVAPVAGALDASHLAAGTAANTARFDREDVQARRLRRERRQERAARRLNGGWTVRMW